MNNSNRVSADQLMPGDEKANRILRSRAEYLAKPIVLQEEADGIGYIRFGLEGSGESYGIPYQFIKEVMNNFSLTKLPFVPNVIAGIVNRRGELMAILDLKTIFHGGVSIIMKDSYIIVISVKNVTVGILADRIEGRDLYFPSILDSPFSLQDKTKQALLIGLHQGLTAIINIENLMLIPELQIMGQDSWKK